MQQHEGEYMTEFLFEITLISSRPSHLKKMKWVPADWRTAVDIYTQGQMQTREMTDSWQLIPFSWISPAIVVWLKVAQGNLGEPYSSQS